MAYYNFPNYEDNGQFIQVTARIISYWNLFNFNAKDHALKLINCCNNKFWLTGAD